MALASASYTTAGQCISSFISFYAQITSQNYHSIFTWDLLTSSSCSVTTLLWILILGSVSSFVDKRHKFASQDCKEEILPTLEPEATMGLGKSHVYSNTATPQFPNHGFDLAMSILWSFHHSTSIHSLPLPFQQYSMLGSMRRVHAL